MYAGTHPPFDPTLTGSINNHREPPRSIKDPDYTTDRSYRFVIIDKIIVSQEKYTIDFRREQSKEMILYFFNYQLVGQTHFEELVNFDLRIFLS